MKAAIVTFALLLALPTDASADSVKDAQEARKAGDRTACEAVHTIAGGKLFLPVTYAKHPERFDEAALAASRACFHEPTWHDAFKACAEAIAKAGAGPDTALEV